MQLPVMSCFHGLKSLSGVCQWVRIQLSMEIGLKRTSNSQSLFIFSWEEFIVQKEGWTVGCLILIKLRTGGTPRTNVMTLYFSFEI